jgi:pimeloyl-ACP methyl ester carboxylesterase
MTVNNRTDPPIGPPGALPWVPVDPGAGREYVTRVGDHEVHAVEYGGGERAMVLLHGLCGSSAWWSRNTADFARDFRVLVPDLIGFGRSRTIGPLPPPDRIALLLRDWLDRRGVDRVSLVGHSMGGQIGIHLAAHAPDRIDRLVLVDSAGIPRPMSPGALIRFAAEAAPVWRWGDPSFLPTIARDTWTAGPRIVLRAVYNILQDDVRPLLSTIRAPTLVVWGEHDSLVPLADAWEFRQGIPDARLAVLRGAAHNPMVDRPEDFNRVVRRFLDGDRVGR